MLRTIIEINEDKCNGCELCVKACHEGAIKMINGKAKLIREDYCDGLGNCLPVCPTGAISFIEKETLPFDENAVNNNPAPLACGCPGTQSRTIEKHHAVSQTHCENSSTESELRQWPVQIQLVPINAKYFDNANLLIAADCVAYAYGNFHSKFMKNRITIIGCPKLDYVDYSEKLCEIIKQNNIRSITVVRMEVPCCGGIEQAVKDAIMKSGKLLPWNVQIISTDGELLDY